MIEKERRKTFQMKTRTEFGHAGRRDFAKYLKITGLLFAVFGKTIFYFRFLRITFLLQSLEEDPKCYDANSADTAQTRKRKPGRPPGPEKRPRVYDTGFVFRLPVPAFAVIVIFVSSLFFPHIHFFLPRTEDSALIPDDSDSEAEDTP
jgi:hypothetical protein